MNKIINTIITTAALEMQGLLYKRIEFRGHSRSTWHDRNAETNYRLEIVDKFILSDRQRWNEISAKCDAMNLEVWDHATIDAAAISVADLIARLSKLPMEARVVIRAHGMNANLVGEFIERSGTSQFAMLFWVRHLTV